MKKIIFACTIGLVITIGISNYSDGIQADLAHNLVRFHVVANSDSEDDQALKLRVRDRIINETKDLFDASGNIDQTKDLIQRNIPLIKSIAQDEVQKWGKNYETQVSVGMYPFPTKKYGDVILPAGNYQALRVVIGKGEGENWWCVLFPPLCFVDATRGVVPDETKQRLKNILTEEEYNIITSVSSEDEIPFVIKFKVVEWWQNSKMKVQTVFNSIK